MLELFLVQAEKLKPSHIFQIIIPTAQRSLSISLSLSLHRRYSPEWASVSFKNFLHPSRFMPTTVQFLHPSFATSSFTPSSQRSLDLPLGRFPPGSLRRTLLARSSSSWCITCPAHLSLLSLQNFTMSFSLYRC
jgi:hypothetical protein